MGQNRKRSILVGALVLLGAATLMSEGIGEIITEAEESSFSVSKSLRENWSPLEFFEGLHITGKPIEIDIDTYRLRIRGLVENELDFTFEEIKGMESVRKEVVLDCTGVFTDWGVWTGVPLKNLLALASPLPEAEKALFSAVDDSYTSSLDLKDINHNGIMVAYHFNDNEFHLYHGYPLRIVAEGWVGGKWVKWLGEIHIE